MKSIIGEIVNQYRKEQRLEELSDLTIYKSIECENSHKQDMKPTDIREAVRTLWLTVDNQQRHHINWENELVNLGFGRHCADTAEFETHGYVVLNDLAVNRIGRCDEMNFSFNGSKNKKGGRPAGQLTNTQIPDRGELAEKSGVKCTLLCGASYNDEAFPILIVLSGKHSETKRLSHGYWTLCLVFIDYSYINGYVSLT